MMGFTGVRISEPNTLRHRVAKAIWEKRPDCQGKTWPLDTPKSVRAYLHEPIASVDPAFIYADAAIAVISDDAFEIDLPAWFKPD